MEEWKTYRLGDFISIKSGLPYKAMYLGKGSNILLGMGCVSFNETFLKSGARLYSDDGQSRYIAKCGDLVLATRQQSDNLPILGMPAIIPDDFEDKRVIVGSNLYMVENNSEIDNDFLFWLLKTPAYVQHIKKVQTGTTVRMITKANIEDFTFKCPSKEERNFISSLLWNIQNKIETNRRINARLEEMAQALFRSWFIDFTPFKQQEFVEDEYGRRPKGWEVKAIDDDFDIKYGKNLAKTKITDMGKYPVYGANGIIGFYTEYNVNNFVALITSRGNGSGDVLHTNDKFAYITNNSFIVKFKQATDFPIFPYSYLLMLEQDFKSRCSGSAQPQLTNSSISTMSIISPPLNVIRDFCISTWPLFDKYFTINKESSRLSTLRDTLLPKLMSGELTPEEITAL